MSTTQVVLLGLIVVAYLLGWFARGRRESVARTPPPLSPVSADIDDALLSALTAYQAALSVWQLGTPGDSALGARVLAAFEKQRRAAQQVISQASPSSAGHGALPRAGAALERLADGLAPFAGGAPLDQPRERALFSAERAVTAGRVEFLEAETRRERPPRS